MNRSPSDSRDPLDELAEEFLERLRRGEHPEIREYTERYPELAEGIEELFPTLYIMEELAPGETAERHPLLEVGPREPSRLGEYRLLREVGRGGMGVVYEAEQESLGRRVALKVLLARAFVDDTHLERFRLEARAAARLHHTNIVPVFGVGEHEGTHYYAMQFIRGQSLAEIIGEVKSLRARSRGSDGLVAAGFPPASDIAASLATGAFVVPRSEEEDAERIEPATRTTTQPVSAPGVDRSEISASSTTVLTRDGSTSTQVDPDSTYFRSVARIVMNVADALAYAHGEGVLHRDIKPSNLLLDTRGAVWMTDFGLAKSDDSDDLTQSGNVVGTLRYMAPERFRGESDARSDVYSLGVTLYELLALRPAFDASDRATLVQQIAQREPTPLRRVDPRIPRDLETIVEKAAAKEARDRYATSAELEADLRRFLSYQPISARRFTMAERGWRWCQRNPAIAVLTVLAVVLTAVLAVVSTVSAVRLGNRLAEAKLEEGRAWRQSGERGQRLRALAALTEAARRAPSREIRNEVIAAWALTDIEEIERWETEESVLHFDRFGERSARARPDQSIEVFDAKDRRRVIAKLPAIGLRVWWMGFSPDGRTLAATYHSSTTRLVLWDLATQARVLEADVYAGGLPVAFAPDGKEIVVIGPDRTASVRSFPGGELVRKFAIGERTRWLAWSPDGRDLALSGKTLEVTIYDVERGVPRLRLIHPRHTERAYWHPSLPLLAVSCFDGGAHVWDTETGERVFHLQGHSAECVDARFDHSGRFLVTSGWDGRVALWDVLSGERVLGAWGHAVAFTRDDSGIVFRIGRHRHGVWRVAKSRDFQRIHVPTLGRKSPTAVQISPDRRWVLAATGPSGIALWPADEPSRQLRIELGWSAHAVFAPSSDAFYAASSGVGVERWAIRRSSEAHEWVVGPGEALGIPGTGPISLSRDGRRLSMQDRSVAVVYELPGSRELFRRDRSMSNYAELSPDGRWIAIGNWQGEDLEIWDVDRAELVKKFKSRTARGSFSPDGRWFAFLTGPYSDLYQTDGWRLVGRHERSTEGDLPGAASFSGDGRVLAIASTRGRVDLYGTQPFAELARFDGSTVRPHVTMCSLSADRSLLAYATIDHRVEVWNLRSLRERLRSLGLDWSAPSIDSAALDPVESLLVDYGKDDALRRPPVRPRSAELEGQVAAYTELVAADPTAEVHRGRAALLRKFTLNRAALDDLERASTFAPQAFDLSLERAELQAKLGDGEAAAETAATALELVRAYFGGIPAHGAAGRKEWTRTFLRCARIIDSHGSRRAALDVYLEIVRENAGESDRFEAFVRAGALAALAGTVAEADEMVERVAAETAPRFKEAPELKFVRAALDLRRGRLAAAAAALDAMGAGEAESLGVRVELCRAQVALRRGDIDASRRIYSDARTRIHASPKTEPGVGRDIDALVSELESALGDSAATESESAETAGGE